jgi:hypothetical protein
MIHAAPAAGLGREGKEFPRRESAAARPSCDAGTRTVDSGSSSRLSLPPCAVTCCMKRSACQALKTVSGGQAPRLCARWWRRSSRVLPRGRPYHPTTGRRGSGCSLLPEAALMNAASSPSRSAGRPVDGSPGDHLVEDLRRHRRGPGHVERERPQRVGQVHAVDRRLHEPRRHELVEPHGPEEPGTDGVRRRGPDCLEGSLERLTNGVADRGRRVSLGVIDDVPLDDRGHLAAVGDGAVETCPVQHRLGLFDEAHGQSHEDVEVCGVGRPPGWSETCGFAADGRSHHSSCWAWPAGRSGSSAVRGRRPGRGVTRRAAAPGRRLH